MDVYVLIQCENQGEYVDYYGSSASARQEILGVYSSFDTAKDAMHLAQIEDDKCVREYETDPCDFVIEHHVLR